MRNFELPGRSLVMARNGMAATSHPASTLAAINVLQAGGNAMDAAIAACAVQGVVEPGSTGIGGDCFALYARGGRDDVLAFNGSGRAPAAATPAALAQVGVTEWTRHSAHVVTVPGAVDAWATLAADHGTRPLGELLQPAIALAEQGFAVAPRCAADWAANAALLRQDPEAARIYLPGGQAPAAGDVHHLRELAATLRAIAAGGREAFYQGTLAEGMVGFLQARGGLHTAADFAACRGEYATPIRTRFRGVDILECPPNGQGVIALLIMNILSGFPADGDPTSPERLHLEIEATRLAYAARDAWLGDPLHGPVDVQRLLSMEFAQELRARIDPGQAAPRVDMPEPAAHKDTVYICVVDKERNCASFINSIFQPFGSGLVAPGGVLLHNRGQSFSLQPGHANTIAGRKRPLHTIIPGMAVQDGRVRMPFGVMGGHYQAMGHAHLVAKVFDYGLDPQTAIDLPRVFPVPGTRQVEAEATLPEATRAALARMGHALIKPGMAIGGAQAILIDWERGVLHGGSDPRKDGCALGY